MCFNHNVFTHKSQSARHMACNLSFLKVTAVTYTSKVVLSWKPYETEML